MPTKAKASEDIQSIAPKSNPSVELEMIERKIDKSEDDGEIEALLGRRRQLRREIERTRLQKRLTELDDDSDDTMEYF